MITTERYAFDSFHAQWNQGKFHGQRLGQAFYNYFNLQKMTSDNKNIFDTIYEKDSGEALNLIKQNVEFH